MVSSWKCGITEQISDLKTNLTLTHTAGLNHSSASHLHSLDFMFRFFSFLSLSLSAVGRRWGGTHSHGRHSESWADVVSWDEYELPLGTVFTSASNFQPTTFDQNQEQRKLRKQEGTSVTGRSVWLLVSVALSHFESIKIRSSNADLQALKSAFFLGSFRADLLWFTADDKCTCRAAQICSYCSHLPAR